ncbi:AraC family transcriptional regulator [Streptomyces venezuelae]|uniref:AraC family transcriptional regulator n=1 Tax=Streptomyces venezuelae TaxID=54571 RepID=A0A5P2CX80_STRVZ|nr:AraC family transcriptional regulator [Streptomyces venezuelae]QES47514.1 AraC family transcriptional regulator [Streptomyces venezuelae]
MSHDDVLSELLKPLRLTDIYSSKWLAGGVWGVAGHEDSHAVMHYMVRRACYLTFDDEEPIKLCQGDLAVFPHGTAHTFASAPGRATTQLTSVLPQRVLGGSGVVTLGSSPPDTEILCASLHYDTTTKPALYRALPRVIVLRRQMLQDEPLLLRTLQSLDREITRSAPGSRLVSLRAFEMVFILALRTAMQRLTETSPALQALQHEGISKALIAIYGAYTAPWTVEGLAREAGMSRSVFSEVFRELVGEPPARHLMVRRLQEARRLLADGTVPQRDVYKHIGYQSHVGYHLAFRKEFGMTPGEYRAQTRPG